MAVIVEDGTRVADSNSYVSEAELTEYAAARGITLTTGAEQLLIQAMDYIEQQQFRGIKVMSSQSLQWPRYSVYIDGYEVATDTIPKDLKNAQMATALAIEAGNDPLSPTTPAIKREKVDVLEVEYQDGAASDTFDPKVNLFLSKLISNGGGGSSSFSVSRA